MRTWIAAFLAFVLLAVLPGCPEESGDEDEKLPDINGPMAPDNLRVWNQADSIRIEWTQPRKNDNIFNRDLLGFLILRSEGEADHTQPSREERFEVGDTLGAQIAIAVIDTEPVGDLEREFYFIDDTVTPGVTYHYQIFCFDEMPNYSDPIPFEGTAGGLAQARLTHTQTVLEDGRLLLTGGIGFGGPLDSAEIFDPATGEFSLLSDRMAKTRFGHAATLLADGRVLVTGGYEEGFAQILDSAEIFDPGTGTFRLLKADMIHGRALHTATLLPDGTVLIVGGTDGTLGFEFAEIFDPVTETFTAVADTMTTPRFAHTATLMTGPSTGRVLIAGGLDGFATADTATWYTTATEDFGRFVTVPDDEEDPMARGRMYHSGTLLGDGSVVFAGGFSGETSAGDPIDSIEVFDPTTGEFSEAATLAHARSGHQAALDADGRVVIVGGIDPVLEILETSEIYDPANGQVLPGPTLNVARTVAQLSVLADGSLFITGGNASSDPFLPAPLSTAEILEPGASAWTLWPAP
ncbi:MAG: hypothetical protein KJ042_13300 [Deltaproteobacteria bacterium]|nr:hypothetical protein [Deltaproteobacteria bacterium]